MATKTVTIYSNGTAYVSRLNPNLVNSTEKIAVLTSRESEEKEGWINFYQFCFVQFQIPQDVVGKRFVKSTLHLYGQTDVYRGRYCIRPVLVSWEPSETSYYRQPSTGGYETTEYINAGYDFSWRSREYTNTEQGADITTFGFMVAASTSVGPINFYTSNSDHKPYLELTYDDEDSGVFVSELIPDGRFLDENWARIQFCTQNMPSTIGIPQITKANINWSYNGQSFTQTLQTFDSRLQRSWWYSSILPENKLPKTGNVSWSVTITDRLGNVRASKTATFSTTDSTIYATAVDPANVYVDGSEGVYLHWTRNISTGTLPAGADFQASGDGGVTWKELGHADGYNNFLVPPGKLPSGNVLWRVRGYNSDNVAGPWSESVSIIVRQAPNIPVISEVTNFPSPIVSWQSEDQQAHQLQIGTWDSGVVFGTDKIAQCPELLPDGTTTVRLRVQNKFGMWSQWAETSINIKNRPGEAITLQAKAIPPGIRLTWSTTGTYSQYIIYRDGVDVGNTTSKKYTDYTGNGKCAYIVRGVSVDSTYTDSPRQVEILRLNSGYIAVVGTWDWLPLKCLRGRYPGVTTSQEAEITYTQYSGRQLPVAEISGHYTRQHQLEFTLRRRQELDKLRDMVGQLVIYKDLWERVLVGILGDLEEVSNWAADVSFTITEVDHGTVF